jgi:hypothetical protein
VSESSPDGSAAVTGISASPGRQGTLELNEWKERVWVKVHPSREGSWAIDLARELAELPTP